MKGSCVGGIYTITSYLVFSILVASFRQGEGDSGSRHAMKKAKEYGRNRFVMFNEITDKNQAIFGLNEDLIMDNVTTLTKEKIKEI